jgi:hypothetical protein
VGEWEIISAADACLTSTKLLATFTDTADMTRRKLLRVVEIAEILGVSKQRADQLRREPKFPTPVSRLAGELGAPYGPRPTFDGGRGPTPAERPGGVAGPTIVDSPPRRRALASTLMDPAGRRDGKREDDRQDDRCYPVRRPAVITRDQRQPQ